MIHRTLPTTMFDLWRMNMAEARELTTSQLQISITAIDKAHRSDFCVCFTCACRVVLRERRSVQGDDHHV